MLFRWCLARQCVGANEFDSQPLEGGQWATKDVEKADYLFGRDATRSTKRARAKVWERVRAVARVPTNLILLIPVRRPK